MRSGRANRIWGGKLLGLALLPLSGCALVSDAFNPNLLTGLGLDPSTIRGSQGVVLISFNNTSEFIANFFVAVSDSPTDPTSNAFGVPGTQVQPGEIRTAVVDCPLGVVTPGAPSANFATGTVAIQVFPTEMPVEVVYNGAPLQAGDEFRCGDVIEMRLIQTGDGLAPESYRILIRVIPS